MIFNILLFFLLDSKITNSAYQWTDWNEPPKFLLCMDKKTYFIHLQRPFLYSNSSCIATPVGQLYLLCCCLHGQPIPPVFLGWYIPPLNGRITSYILFVLFAVLWLCVVFSENQKIIQILIMLVQLKIKNNFDYVDLSKSCSHKDYKSVKKYCGDSFIS